MATLSNEILTNLNVEVLCLFVEVFDEEGRPEIDEDNFSDFVERCVNTLENESKAQDAFERVFAVEDDGPNWHTTLALINFINEYLEGYDTQRTTGWDYHFLWSNTIYCIGHQICIHEFQNALDLRNTGVPKF
jgi:hypothetical protein